MRYGTLITYELGNWTLNLGHVKSNSEMLKRWGEFMLTRNANF